MWFADRDALLERLVHGCRHPNRPVVFLVGSPLTAPSTRPPSGAGLEAVVPRAYGVPGVEAMVESIRRDYADSARTLLSLEKELSREKNRYQAALRHLLYHRGPQGPADLVRNAVLQARITGHPYPASLNDAACKRLENDLDGWFYSPGVEALGHLVEMYPEQFGETLLTSNFDPLVELAVRRTGGKAYVTVLHGDASLEQTLGVGCHVVHLHGYWYGTDTLHTPVQLVQERPQLRASLGRLLRRNTLVVMAYGGWDDVFTRTLAETVTDLGEFLDIVWTFYEDEAALVERNHAGILEILEPAVVRGRAVLYKGVDCHTFLPDLVRALDGELTEDVPPPSEEASPLRRAAPVALAEGGFLGRQQEKESILAALEAGEAVMLLGDRRMGKSSLLQWLLRHLANSGRPTAFVNVLGLLAQTPDDFWRAVSESPMPHESTRKGPFVLVVDEASAMASPGNAFDSRFFADLDMMRQDGRLIWIAASEQDLYELFKQAGVDVPFLRDATRIYAGALDPEETSTALTRILADPALADKAARLSGGIPLAVAWLGTALSRRPGEAPQVEKEFLRWIEPFFLRWWSHFEEKERSLLAQTLGGGLEIADLAPADLATGRGLVDRGFLLEKGGCFKLEGVAWKGFVERKA